MRDHKDLNSLHVINENVTDGLSHVEYVLLSIKEGSCYPGTLCVKKPKRGRCQKASEVTEEYGPKLW